ncbi:MAG: RNA polymerase sporulation sigma factor SigK [Paraclostridium sp.]
MSTSRYFERPLTSEEEISYLTKFKEYKDEYARAVLISRNMRLVAAVAKKYYNTTDDRDDIISIGTIGLIKAIETYNLERGAKLSTYAARCIENEILMSIRYNKKNEGVISMEDAKGQDKDGGTLTWEEILGTDKDDTPDQVELRLQIASLYETLENQLTSREREIIKLRYGLTPLGYITQIQIAKKLEISRSYVSRIEKKALKKLKKQLESKTYI